MINAWKFYTMAQLKKVYIILKKITHQYETFVSSKQNKNMKHFLDKKKMKNYLVLFSLNCIETILMRIDTFIKYKIKYKTMITDRQEVKFFNKKID